LCPARPAQRARRPSPNFSLRSALSRARLMSDAGGAGQKASRSADPAPATKDKKQRTAKLPPSNYPLALLPTAGGDGQDEGGMEDFCRVCFGKESLVNTKTCNRALTPHLLCPFTLMLLSREFVFGAALIHCRVCNEASHAQCVGLRCLAEGCISELHVQCWERAWLCSACTSAQGPRQVRHDANRASREEEQVRKQQEEKQEMKKQLA
jgi:hypothetical protein